MRITRLYTGGDGESHFEEIEVALTPSDLGAASGGASARATCCWPTT